MRYAVVLVLVFCVAGGVTVGDDLRDCTRAFADEDWQTAIAPCTKAAERGDAGAQFCLGWMYNYGDGVPQDHAKALEWYTKAAHQGHAEAQNSLGWIYLVTRDPQDHSTFLYGSCKDNEAVDWFTKAAEQGNADAQGTLGSMYRNGWCVARDDTTAVEWYTKAAEQGDAGAQYGLGLMYKEGFGVAKEQDLKLAYFWWNLAALFDEDLLERLIVAGMRDSLAKQMTPQEIAEAKRMSAEWYEKFKARQKD